MATSLNMVEMEVCESKHYMPLYTKDTLAAVCSHNKTKQSTPTK